MLTANEKAYRATLLRYAEKAKKEGVPAPDGVCPHCWRAIDVRLADRCRSGGKH